MSRKKKVRKILFLLGVTFFFLKGISSADDGQFWGNGNTVFPLQNNQIEMVSEKVYVKEASNEWRVECSFIFRNTGKDTVVQMGFPDSEAFGADIPDQWAIENFKAYVNKKPVEVTVKEGKINEDLPNLKYKRVFVWNVPFKINETKLLKNTYSFGESGTSDGESYVNYVLKTGALWKGNIGKADIAIEFLTPPGIDLTDILYKVKPEGCSIGNNKISWHFSNFKPDEDIYISYFGFSGWLQEETIKHAPLSPEMATRQLELGKKYRGKKQKEILLDLIKKYPEEKDICQEAKNILDASKNRNLR